MANLYDKAGLVNIPVGYQDGFLYNIKPEDNTLGFRFNRDSAATRVNKEGLIEQVGYFGPELVQNGNFSELGSELIPDGNFTNQAAVDYWQIANTGGVERATKSLENGFMRLTYDIAIGAALFKSGIVTSGKSYKVTFRAKGTANSNFNSIGDNANIPSNPQYVVSNPTLTDDWQNYEFYVPVSSTVFRLYLTSAQIGDTLDITNISVKQVDPNDYWTLGTGWSIEDGKANAVNASNQSLSQSTSSVLLNKKYRISFDVEYISGSAKFQLVGAAAQDVATITSSGTQVIEVVSNENKTSYRVKGLTTGSGFNGSIDNISITEVLGDKPRIDYTDSLTSPSFLLEPQSTNLIPYSEDFSQSSWVKQSSGAGSPPVVTSNYSISPSGTLSADRVVFNINGGTTSSDFSQLAESVTSNIGDLTNSIFIKSNTASNYNMSFVNPIGGTPTSIVVTSEWQRFNITSTLTTTTSILKLRLRGNEATSDFADVSVWGAQLEQQSYPTSYIPTAGSTATRAQETCNGAGNASTFNSTEGVLYAEIAALANDGTNRRISISNGSTSDRVILGYTASSNQLIVLVSSNSVSGVASLVNIDNSSQFNKIALKYKLNDFALWINGIKVLTDNSLNSPIGLNDLSFEGADNLNPFYGKTKGIYVFNEALTDDELQQLTGPEYNSFAALAAAYNYTVI